MRRSTPLVAAVALALVQIVTPLAQGPAPSGAGTPADSQLLLIDLFRDYLEALRVRAGIPGLAAAIVGRNDVLWEREFGQQNVASAIATRTDTPFHVDGLVQPLTSAVVLRCVEEGRFRLDDPLGSITPQSGEPASTIRQVLSHTTLVDGVPTFQYRASRYDLLTPAIEVCTGAPLRQAYTDMLERLSMADSVPGQDAPRALASAIASQNDLTQLRSELAARMERYTRVLDRLATPYSVDSQRRPSPSQYVSGTLTPATGLISTVRDLAKFDLALRRGILLRPETTAAAWKPQSGRDEKPLPHGLGWFVQTYRGEPVVWQFGLGENASSSLIVTLPARSLTFVLLANSSGLAKAFPLASGDLTVSPFGRVFLGFFVR